MNVGILWLGSDFSAAKEYFIKKYKRIPDEVEIAPAYAKKLGIPEGMIYGMRVSYSKNIQYGNTLIGVSKDVDILEYIKVKEG